MYESHEAMLAAQRAENKTRRHYIDVFAKPPCAPHRSIVAEEVFVGEYRCHFIRQRVDALLASGKGFFPAQAVTIAYEEYLESIVPRDPFEEFGELAKRD